MSRRRNRGDEFRHLAGDISSEDGGDPKAFHAKPWNAPKQAGRKAKQLCEQVKNALLGALAACGDPAVQCATVVAVQPAPHSGRLRVLVSAPVDLDHGAVAAGLTRAAGLLRNEVARAICRRYAPELVFEVVPS